MKSKLIIKVFPLLLALLIYSCDFFAPYDLEFVELSADTLNFGLFENQKQFVIAYKDSFDVSWEVTSPLEWIEITPLSGIINIENPDTLNVKINRKKLSPGFYDPEIIINFQDKTNTQSVKIIMEIKAIVSISRKSFSFDFSDSLERFTISNEGNYPLKWNFKPKQEWISIKPDSGVLNIDSTKFLSKLLNKNTADKINDTTITIRIDNSKLKVGDNVGIVELITNTGAEDSIKIDASKASAPLLSLNTTELDFGEELTSQKISLDNLGEESLSWSASTNDKWIKINPSSGDLINSSGNYSNRKINEVEVEISVDRTGLQPGVYNSSVQISSNGGDAVINVTMIVPAEPSLSATPVSLDFGTSEIFKKIQISNSGTGILTWNAEASESWITVTPQSDSISNGSKDLNVSVLRLGLLPGNYTGNVNINSNGGSITIPVNMSVPQFPILDFSPSSLSFTEENTESSFEIRNLGADALIWQLSSNQEWIEVSPSSGTTNTETDIINVSVITAGLAAGTYSGSIEISSDFGSGSIQVSLIIQETITSPKLSFSPSVLKFEESESSKSFEIKNEGDADLSWQISSNQPWIELTSTSGKSLPNQKDEINVKVKRDGLSPGSYSGIINISSDGGSGNIEVNMTVSGTSPVLSVSPGSLNFGDTELSKTIVIENNGDSDLTWQLTGDKSWINITIKSGTTAANQTDEIEIQVTRNGLTEGDYSGIITVSSNGGNDNINIKMTVKSISVSRLSVNPSKLNFGEKDTSKSFEIRNNGDGVLEWNLKTDEPWIVLTQTSGITGSKEKSEVEIIVDRSDLPAGEYSGIIEVTSNGGTETVEINITVVEDNAPKLSINPTKYNFGSKDTVKTIGIKNSGSGILEWELTTNESWIFLSQISGITGSKEKSEVEIIVDRSDLPAGEYSGIIEITSNGGTETVEINITVDEDNAPKLSINPTKYNFGSKDTVKTIGIKNSGSGILEWKLTTNESWIFLSQISGITGPKEESEVEIIVDRSDLLSGDYSGTIEVTSNGGNETVEVNIKVDENNAPKLSINPTKYNFGSKDTVKTIGIKNSGSGILEWDLTTNESWIFISQTNGTTGPKEESEVEITVDRSDLLSGDYSGTIEVTSNGGNETVEISITVDGNPKIDVSENKLDFGSALDLLSFNISNKGTGTLEWSVDQDLESWISVSPIGGTITTEETTVEVKIDRDVLSPGSYKSSINISSNGGNKSVTVNVDVLDEPQLSVSEVELDFGETETEKTFDITNTGNGELVWELSKDAGWISASPTSGSTATETDRIVVNVDRELAVGTLSEKVKKKSTNSYIGNITVQSSSETKNIVVKMSIPESPELWVSHESIDFGTSVEQVILEIKNNGGGTLTWGLILDVDWIHIDAANGETTTETDSITLTPIRDLSSGTHTGTIRVVWDSGDLSIPVEITII